MTQLIDDVPVAATAAAVPAWEQVGTRIDRAKSGPDALRAAKLDWQVEQWPVQATDPRSWKTVPVECHLANVRSDTRELLGVVGKGYRAFQNADLFEFLDALVADRLVSYHAAGSLRGGRRVWVLCRLAREFRAGPGDVVRPYLLVANGHGGEWADHQRAARGRDALARAEGRLDSVWFGAGHRVKAAAYRSALGLAGLN
jgi:hypothetical protein